MQRLRQRATQQTRDAAPTNMSEVNPEFLAALPPSIQEEVLAQQRLEQQRQAAVAANPDDPVDAAEFFQNLQPSLRQAVSWIHVFCFCITKFSIGIYYLDIFSVCSLCSIKLII